MNDHHSTDIAGAARFADDGYGRARPSRDELYDDELSEDERGADEIDEALAEILDPPCRFIGREGHACRTSFGFPLQPGQRCFSETRARLLDEFPELAR